MTLFAIVCIASILWLIFAASLMFSPFLGSDNLILGAYTLNELGDMLAGFFAPLAFVWFFMATWLQRKELIATREVLNAQREELRATADANSKQVDLMEQTLSTSLTRTEYEEYHLRLYYAFEQIHRSRTVYLGHTSSRHGRSPVSLYTVFPKDDVEWKSADRDDRIDLVARRLIDRGRSVFDEMNNITEFNKNSIEQINNILIELNRLLTESPFIFNKMCEARNRALSLMRIRDILEKVVRDSYARQTS
ncbi:hypothetical protein [Salinarimonas ramus]|uniref:Uncharacterized protein n=1 Tax=Salinarimonas ramus TaxID=690164 RepID=A0A917VA12_9HYPH|nr:hypothetical protein [Salinarimonas ramus]GGK54466.1 hypothetical protein GCM10011322_46580 [Salinarimonas ramus]